MNISEFPGPKFPQSVHDKKIYMTPFLNLLVLYIFHFFGPEKECILP